MSGLDILIIGAHPDDAEIGMGGTIRKHVLAGYKVGICDLTLAEMSSNGTVETRKQEAAEASRVLGLAYRSNLELPDRGIAVCKEHIDKVVMEIRRTKPRMVFAPYWKDRHPDHVTCGHIVQEAVFNSKLRNYLPESGLAAHQVGQLFFYFINDLDEADLVIDVSACYDGKTASLLAYRTQFEPAGPDNDFVQTPINQAYLERVEARDRLLGQKLMVRYAEGFVTKLPHLVELF